MDGKKVAGLEGTNHGDCWSEFSWRISRVFAILPSSSKGWSTTSQDVSSGWWKDQEGERVQVQVQLKRG